MFNLNKQAKSKKLYLSLGLVFLIVSIVMLSYSLSAAPAQVSFNQAQIGYYYFGDLATAAKRCEQLTGGQYPIPSNGNMRAFVSPWGCYGKAVYQWNKATNSYVAANPCRSDGVSYSFLNSLTCREQLPGEPSPLDNLPATDKKAISFSQVSQYYRYNAPQLIMKPYGAQRDILANIHTANKVCEDVTNGQYPYAHYFTGFGYWGCSDENLYYLNGAGTAWYHAGSACGGGGIELAHIWGNNYNKIICAGTQVECFNDGDCDDGNSGTDDVCINPGTENAYCENNVVTCFNDGDCDDGNSGTEDICINPGTGDSFCQYNDITCFNNGDCNDGNAYTEDICINPGSVNSYCQNNPLECINDADCPVGEICVDNECVECEIDADCGYNELCIANECEEITCSDDVDCDDSDPYTYDACVLPGTLLSYCNYQTIECLSSSECGTDTLLGQEFCQNEDLFDNFLDYTCVDPGTPDAYCTDSTDPILVEDCLVDCIGDTCVIPECLDDSECGDNQICYDYECTDIVCDEETDCGIDGLLDQLFCQGNILTDTYVDYNCESPGTIDSSCSQTTSTQFIEDCTFGCEDGEWTQDLTDALVLGYNFEQTTGDIINIRNPGYIDLTPTGSQLAQDGIIDYGVAFDGSGNLQSGDADSIFTDDTQTLSFWVNFTETGTKNILDYGDNLGNNVWKVLIRPAGGVVCYIATGTTNNIETPESRPINDGQFYHLVCRYDGENLELYIDGILEESIGITGNIGNTAGIDKISWGEQWNGLNDITGNIDEAYFFDTVLSQNQISQLYNNGNGITYNEEFNPSYCLLECYDDLDCGDNQICDNNQCTDIVCDEDSDCGTNGLLGQLFCQSDDVYDLFQTYTCNNPGTLGSSCSDSTTPQLVQTCTYGCDSGACLTITCSNDNDCDDSDPYTGDTCVDPGTVDSYCEYEPLDCIQDGDCGVGEFCIDFECIPVECFNDNDCNDGDAYTEDVCILPGTAGAFCRNYDIECFSDSDCGTNRFLEQYFCQNSDSFDWFITYTCNDPGIGTSFCTDSQTSFLDEDCDYGCMGGVCLPQCTNDSDCGNMEICYDEECIAVECIQDSDCGTSGFLDQLFCQDNDVFDFFITYTCEDQGTPAAACSSTTDPLVFENCGDDGCDDWQPTYCQDGDVYHDRDCYLRGCLNEACFENSDGIETELVADCDYGCSDGMCENAMQCEDGADNDVDGLIDALDPGCWTDPNDPNTYDPDLEDESVATSQCQDGVDNDDDGLLDEEDPGCWDDPTDPGSSNPYLYDESDYDIDCTQDLDCGTDGFTGDLYCQSDDVYEDYNIYTCTNPGIGTSACIVDITPTLRDECDSDEDCFDGSCEEEGYECGDDDDCDNDEYCDNDNQCRDSDCDDDDDCRSDEVCENHECVDEDDDSSTEGVLRFNDGKTPSIPESGFLTGVDQPIYLSGTQDAKVRSTLPWWIWMLLILIIILLIGILVALIFTTGYGWLLVLIVIIILLLAGIVIAFIYNHFILMFILIILLILLILSLLFRRF